MPRVHLENGTARIPYKNIYIKTPFPPLIYILLIVIKIAIPLLFMVRAEMNDLVVSVVETNLMSCLLKESL